MIGATEIARPDIARIDNVAPIRKDGIGNQRPDNAAPNSGGWTQGRSQTGSRGCSAPLLKFSSTGTKRSS